MTVKREAITRFVKKPIPQGEVILMLGTVIFIILGAVWAHSNGTFATKDMASGIKNTAKGIKELVIMNKNEIKEVRKECNENFEIIRTEQNEKFEKIRLEQKADLKEFRTEQKTDFGDFKEDFKEFKKDLKEAIIKNGR